MRAPDFRPVGSPRALDGAREQQDRYNNGNHCDEQEEHGDLGGLGRHLDARVQQQSQGHGKRNDPSKVVLINGGKDGHAPLAYSPGLRA